MVTKEEEKERVLTEKEERWGKVRQLRDSGMERDIAEFFSESYCRISN